MQFHRPPAIYVEEVQIKVTQLKRSVEFYQNILGFKVLEQSEHKAQLSSGKTRPILSLVHPENAAPKQEGTTGLYHFALRMPSRADLALFVKHLAGAGIKFGAGDHLVSEAIYFADPDGSGIEVYADTDPSTWEWDNGRVKMDTLPVDFDRLLAAANPGRVWQGLPADAILGHIHLHVSHLQEAEEFYTQGLGFEVVLRYRGALFMSTERYHHHVAVNIWNGLGAPRPPQNSAGLDYFTVVFPSNARLDQAVQDLQTLGAVVKDVDGRLMVEDPSGNVIRLTVWQETVIES